MTGRPDQEVMANPRAERVRSVARLAGRSARLRAGAFLVEGPQGCREALRAHPEIAAFVRWLREGASA